MAKKDPQTLLSGKGSKSHRRDPPLTVVLDYLTTTEGEQLEVLTKTTPMLASAALIGLIYTKTIIDEGSDSVGCEYVSSRVEQIERMAISMDGKGRDDLISALSAGKGADPSDAPSSFVEVE